MGFMTLPEFLVLSYSIYRLLHILPLCERYFPKEGTGFATRRDPRKNTLDISLRI